MLGLYEGDYLLSSGKIQTFLSKGRPHAGIWGRWVHAEPSAWFEELLFFLYPVYFNLFNGNDVWKEWFYYLLKQWKHNCKERVKEINFSYTFTVVSMLIILRMLWLRKDIHIYEKKAHEQKNKKSHKQTSVMFWEGEGENSWDTKQIDRLISSSWCKKS